MKVKEFLERSPVSHPEFEGIDPELEFWMEWPTPKLEDRILRFSDGTSISASNWPPPLS